MTQRKRTRKPTSDALELLDRMIGKDRRLRTGIERARLEMRIAQEIYDARTSAKLSRKKLARMAGTTQSVIERLEEADYARYSLTMLQRIAWTLHKHVEVRLVP